MKKDFAKVYSYTKKYILRPDESGYDYEYSNLKAHRNNRIYSTKMNQHSLPEYFCDVMRYGCIYYNIIDSRCVSDLKYKWFKINHFMKDSSLEITFINGEKENVYSYEIFKYLAYVKKYSGYDISVIREEFIKQCNWLVENEPEFAPDTEDFGNWFDNKISEYEK